MYQKRSGILRLGPGPTACHLGATGLQRIVWWGRISTWKLDGCYGHLTNVEFFFECYREDTLGLLCFGIVREACFRCGWNVGLVDQLFFQGGGLV
jgi:hypothetical protein